jgi:hypothetical protein
MSNELTIDITNIVPWGPAKRVQTRNGERNLRKAPASDAFRALWKTNKDALKAAGISWDVDHGGEFTGNICWWSAVTQ